MAEVSSIANTVEALKKLNVWTVGLDADGKQSIFGLALLSEPVAIIVGAEGGGLSRLVHDRVDVVASIPIHGPVESLNASVAAALAVYEVAGEGIGRPPAAASRDWRWAMGDGQWAMGNDPLARLAPSCSPDEGRQ